MKITAFFTALARLLTGQGKKSATDNSVVTDFELNRYLGDWYEIARFNHRFERGIEQSKAQYTLRDDGKIKVLNTGIKDDKFKEAKGVAKLTDTPALLRVSFFGPFYADYRVMLIDADYQHALIGSGSNSYLWILSRTPRLSEDAKTKILSEAQRRGYNISQLIWVEQI